MRTKTATAVLLALLGAANAADIDDTGVTNADYKTKLKPHADQACAGAVATYLSTPPATATAEQKVNAATTSAVMNGTSAFDGCFKQAQIVSGQTANKAVKYCVNYIPKVTSAANPANDKALECTMHSVYTLKKDVTITGAEAIYMLGGKYQDDVAITQTAAEKKAADDKIAADKLAAEKKLARAKAFKDLSATLKVDPDNANGFVTPEGRYVVTELVDEKYQPKLTTDNKLELVPYVPLSPHVFDPPVGVQRSCRCAGGSYEYVRDANGQRIQLLHPETKAKVTNKEGGAVWDVKWTDCPAEPTHYITNWVQLPQGTNGPKYPLACPKNWVIPEDPKPKDMGTFKGAYTNKYSFSNVNDSSWAGDGKIVSFLNESADMNGWVLDSAVGGAVAGFGLFGVTIIYIVIMIVLDMRARMRMYEEYIAEDLQKMSNLGMNSKMKEINDELAARMAGGQDDTGVDDQLVTQALELANEEFAQYM